MVHMVSSCLLRVLVRPPQPLLGISLLRSLSSWIQIISLCVDGLIAHRLSLSWFVAAVVPLIGTYLFWNK